MQEKKANAFVTTRKGSCYLTIKIGRQNFNLTRIMKYTIDAEEKRSLRRIFTDVEFDWKKITAQLAEKKIVCRQYRSRQRRERESSHLSHRHVEYSGYAVFDPFSRTVYVDEAPRSARGAGALLDAVLEMDRNPPTRRTSLGFTKRSSSDN